jgi:hypothetical protein
MNINLLTIVKQIIAANGEEILENPQRLKAFFDDLAKDEPKPLRIVFGSCVENGAYNALKTAPDSIERASRKAAIAQRLRDDLGLDPAISGEALDILEAAIGVTSPPPRCKTCGKEIQPEWKVCPYCGAGTAATTTPKPAAPASPPPLTPAVQDAAPAAAPAKKKAVLRNVLIAVGVVVIAVVAAFIVNKQKGAPIPEDFVFIEGGTFTMGSPESEPERWEGEGPQHQVTVSGFYMGKYEVTQEEYKAVMGTNPSDFEGTNLPVENVSWYDAIEYCNKRSEREGLKPAYTIDKSRFDPNNEAPTEGEYDWDHDNIRWIVNWNRDANGCPPMRNGNTPAVREQQRRLTQGTI